MGLFIFFLLVLLILSAIFIWPHSGGWAYASGSVYGFFLLVFLVFAIII